MDMKMSVEIQEYVTTLHIAFVRNFACSISYWIKTIHIHYKAAINLVAGVPVTDVTEYLNSTAWDNWRQDQGFDYPGNAWTNNKKYTSNAM